MKAIPVPPEPPEIVSPDDTEMLQEFGRGLARMNDVVKHLTVVRAGIVRRAFDIEENRLDRERYG